MSIFLKPMGYLTMVAASVGGAGYAPGVSGQGPNVTATVKDERPVQLPHPPLKIPMPLDKAGYKVDATFEVPSSLLLKNMTYLSHYFIGLRVAFTPGTSDVRLALENHPVTVRISLYRLEDGQEVRIPLFDSKDVTAQGEYPRRYEVFEVPEGKTIAMRYYSQHSGTPRGTPYASTLVLSFASPSRNVIPGIYRLQVETLEDIPELSGVPSFFVYERHPQR